MTTDNGNDNSSKKTVTSSQNTKNKWKNLKSKIIRSLENENIDAKAMNATKNFQIISKTIFLK